MKHYYLLTIPLIFTGFISFSPNSDTGKKVSAANPAAADTALYMKNPNYSHEIGLYKAYKLKDATVVMLGNSITHGANWNELLGRPDVIERGIPSDVLEGFLDRMDYIYDLNPKVCFIMGGINDIYNWVSVDALMINYIRVIRSLQVRDIIPVIQSTLYAGQDWPNSYDRNKEVTKLNGLLRTYCKKNNLEFIDLNRLMSRDNYLKPELTVDNLHLNGKGYRIWADEVEKVLKKLNL